MNTKSKIEWTEATWNPVTGCTKISEGCKNCYAERFALRLKAMGMPAYKNGFKITLHPETLKIPLRWKKSRMVFVNSMSDMFHEDIPDDYILQVFQVMKEAYWHTFQILTKRTKRLKSLSKKIFSDMRQDGWASNIWMGVTVESEEYKFRINDLQSTGAKTKFLSIEPLLGPIPNLELSNIDWVIVGGESGPNARPIKIEWVIDIKKQCEANSIPFFFKQWGGVNKKKNGRILLGKTWDGMPEIKSGALSLF